MQLLFTLVPALMVLVSPAQLTVPSGTELHIRLTNQVSSDQHSGENVTAVVVAPVYVNGVLAIDFGTELKGKTADAATAVAQADGATEQPAKIRLNFEKIESPSTGSRPLSAVLSEVDNARETVDQGGLITGIKASETYESRMNQGISKLATKNSQLAQILTGVENAIVKKVDPSVTYPSGTDMTLKLTGDLKWTAPANPSTFAPSQPPPTRSQLWSTGNRSARLPRSRPAPPT